jgi:hypothetical protein
MDGNKTMPQADTIRRNDYPDAVQRLGNVRAESDADVL